MIETMWRQLLPSLYSIGAVSAICALLALLLARRRTSRGLPPALAWRRTALELGMLLGTLPWTWLGLTPLGAGLRGLNLVPLLDLASQLRHTPGYAIYQIAANLLFLLPFGALAPLRWPALASLWRLAMIGAGFAATIEIIQYALSLGRVASIDDVLVNVAGAVIGGLLTRRWWRGRPPMRRQRPEPAAEPVRAYCGSSTRPARTPPAPAPAERA
jgi:VanZ family protein